MAEGISRFSKSLKKLSLNSFVLIIARGEKRKVFIIVILYKSFMGESAISPISSIIANVTAIVPYVLGAQRTNSLILQVICIALSIFVPVIGVVFYLLIRPELLIHTEIKEFLKHHHSE